MNKQEFWNDNEKAQKVIQENKALKDIVEEYNKVTQAEIKKVKVKKKNEYKQLTL